MLENWKSCNDKGKLFGALMTDLSKAHHYKAACIWFRQEGPWVNNSYLSERKQKIRCSLQFLEGNSFWSPSRVHFRAITVQCFLMPFICAFKRHRFRSLCRWCTSYTEQDSIDQVISAFEETGKSLFKWLSDNQMKGNTNKCHLLLNNSCKKSI